MADKPAHYYRQSGVIPVVRGAEGPRIALVTSRGSGRWVIPKGIVEPELTAAQSAAEEAWEEAGLRGTVLEPVLGTYEYPKWGGVCTVEVFAMNVEECVPDWPEAAERRREFVPPEEAADRLREPDLAALIPAAVVGSRDGGQTSC